MILKRLYELAEREKLLEDPAFVEMPVPFVIKLGPQGEYLGIEERRGQIPVPSRKKGTPPKAKPDKGKVLSVPKAHGNPASAGFARYFADTLARVLPISDEAKSVKSRNTFWKQIDQAADESRDPALLAVREFGRRWRADPQLAARVRGDVEACKPAAGDRCTFAWDPDEGRTIIEREPVRRWYRQFFAKLTAERHEAGFQGLCQITGEISPLPSSHPGKISGVPGGMATGVSLVSYDKLAFESLGLDGAANAGIGYRAADGYLRALKALIDNKLPDRPRTSLKVGDVLFLFWTRQPLPSFDPANLLDQPEPEQIVNLFQSVEKGRSVAAVQEADFYCLALSANAARAVVRDYLEAPLPQVEQSLSRWFHDLTIVDDSPQYQGQINSCFPLWQLALATALDSDKVPPQVPTQLLEAALKGDPPADSVLAACLRRLRVESGTLRFRPARMALIKLCLNRTHCQGDSTMTETLDRRRTQDPAYVCGRLLAFLARCQETRDFGTSAQILERYFGAASTSPRSVFPTLLRLNRHHLAKIRDENPGFAFNLEAELDELLLPLKDVNGRPDFPAILSLPEQGRFALGFYHQRAEYRRQSAERKAQTESSATASESSDPRKE